jgi:uncharacterized protein with GYD domain
MKITLLVNWKEKEILTVKELNDRIKAEVDKAMQDTEVYDEYLEDYLDCHYNRRELFDFLVCSEAEREEEVEAIRNDIAKEIYDWVNMDISSDYAEVTIEV